MIPRLAWKAGLIPKKSNIFRRSLGYRLAVALWLGGQLILSWSINAISEIYQ